MKVTFENYYCDYLGINRKEFRNGKRIFSSEQRNKPLNQQFVYKLIATVLEENLVFSIAPEFYDDFAEFIDSRKFEGLDDVIKISQDFFKLRLKDFKVREMYRLTLQKDDKSSSDCDNQAVTLTKNILMDTLDDVDEEEKKFIWKKRKEEIEEGRKFVILEENKILATSKISDVDFAGGNIAIFTDPNNRSKGYGKQVVDKCIDWCFKRDILPIYLVEVKNKPSVNLAESLGFAIKSKEVIVSITL